MKRTKLTTTIVSLTLISLLLISAPFTLFSTSAFAQVHQEADLETVLNGLGFTNIIPSEAETFQSGIYQAVLYAELGGYSELNVLSYYPVETENYQTIFTGPEGAIYGGDGYIDPPYPSKIFEVDTEFGLSLSASFRFYTEHGKNEDSIIHVKVYENLDSPNMFLFGFEDQLGGDDKDYNDMVFSIELISTPKIDSVTRNPQEPTSNQPVTVTAQVTKGNAEIQSVILNYQIGTASWINVTMSQNGGSYGAEIPGQTYNTQTNYRVFAFDVLGNYDVSIIDSYITSISESSPRASLIYSPVIADTNEVVDFDASASYDPDGQIVSYLWDFGDGINASGAIVSHSYLEDGEYIVNLRVIDDEDLVGSKVTTILIKNRRPVGAITATASIINENEEVTFDASQSVDLDGTIDSYLWSFGDGTADSGISVTHSYDEIGFYSITLTVIDNDGAADDNKYSVNVAKLFNTSPIAAINVTFQIVNINKIVYFDGSGSYDSDGTVDTYSWDFGDGNTATGMATDHAYIEDGLYKVTLTVTDNAGATDIATTSISVTTQTIDEPNQSPVASFVKSAVKVISGEIVYFDGYDSYDSDGTVDTYSWDFGDGNTATGMAADHAYIEDGIYTVTLTVTDNAGATDTATTTIAVQNQSPEASFIESADTVTLGEIITFDGSESYDSDGTIVSYSWDFGDGTTASGVTTDHTYNEDGTYTATLIVTDNDGDLSSSVTEITVKSDATENTDTESQTILFGVTLGIAALVATLLLSFFIRRRNKKKLENN